MDIYELSNMTREEQLSELSQYGIGELQTLIYIIGTNIDDNPHSTRQSQLFVELKDAIIENIRMVVYELSNMTREEQLNELSQYGIGELETIIYIIGTNIDDNYHSRRQLQLKDAIIAKMRMARTAAREAIISNDEFIYLSTRINELNPEQVYQRYADANNIHVNSIHRRGNGPCPNDINDLRNDRDCIWAQACIAARRYVNDTFERNTNEMSNILNRMNHIIDELANAQTDHTVSFYIRDIYEREYSNHINNWIREMRERISGHRRAEDAMREFRNRCINYYMDKYNYIDNIDNQMFLMRNYIIQDLIDNYTINDVQLMAFHFANIDNIDNKYQLASIVANTYLNI